MRTIPRFRCRRHQLRPRPGHIVVGLEVHPKLEGGSKDFAKPQCCVWDNGSFFARQALDAGARNAHQFRQLVGAHRKGGEELLLENGGRMNRVFEIGMITFLGSVTVSDFNVFGAAFAPCEADARLLVNADRVLPSRCPDNFSR